MPATLYNLWNPYRADDGSVTFEITQADTFYVEAGSQEFVDAALGALGLSIAKYSWDVQAGRSLYYSDDPRETDWRDRWIPTWRVRIEPAEPAAPAPNTLFRTPVALDQHDSSQLENGEDPQQRCSRTAFVIVDFRVSRAEVEQIASSVLGDAGVAASLLEPAIRDVGGGLHQLQVIVRGLSLPEQIAALDEMAAGFKAAGGAVNWRSRLTWPAQPAEPSSKAKSDISAWVAEMERLKKGK